MRAQQSRGWTNENTGYIPVQDQAREELRRLEFVQTTHQENSHLLHEIKQLEVLLEDMATSNQDVIGTIIIHPNSKGVGFFPLSQLGFLHEIYQVLNIFRTGRPSLV